VRHSRFLHIHHLRVNHHIPSQIKLPECHHIQYAPLDTLRRRLLLSHPTHLRSPRGYLVVLLNRRHHPPMALLDLDCQLGIRARSLSEQALYLHRVRRNRPQWAILVIQDRQLNSHGHLRRHQQVHHHLHPSLNLVIYLFPSLT
jgi:hypothetical protein